MRRVIAEVKRNKANKQLFINVPKRSLLLKGDWVELKRIEDDIEEQALKK